VRPIQRGQEKRVDIRLSAADVWQVYLEQVDLVGSVEKLSPGEMTGGAFSLVWT
jgi:hypothetical protein